MAAWRWWCAARARPALGTHAPPAFCARPLPLPSRLLARARHLCRSFISQLTHRCCCPYLPGPARPGLQEDELAGRRRRARAGDGEDKEGGGAALPWPSPFGAAAGSDEEAEDEDLLRKAKQGMLLAESQGMELDGGDGGGGGLGGGGGIPLDEGSQEVLGLLARSCASEPQLGASGGSGPLPRSRFAPPGAPAALVSLGSDPTNNRLPGGGGGGGASSLSRGPSFVGRQPTVQRVASSSGMGGGGRSYVFGRDDSNSAMPADKVGSVVGDVPLPSWGARLLCMPATHATAVHASAATLAPALPLVCIAPCRESLLGRLGLAARRRGPPALPTCASWQACRRRGRSPGSAAAARWSAGSRRRRTAPARSLRGRGRRRRVPAQTPRPRRWQSWQPAAGEPSEGWPAQPYAPGCMSACRPHGSCCWHCITLGL